MKGSLLVRNAQRGRRINLKFLRPIVETLLHELARRDKYELSIRLVDRREMTRLNETFLKHEGSTDVITFDYGANNGSLCGDIVVCVDEAVTQARRFRTTWREEVVRYIVHSTLHLLGYTDTNRRDRLRMKRKEDAWFEELETKFSFNKL